MLKTDPTGKLWMWSLIGSIVVFMLFFLGFAIWTFQTDVELMYDNYYDKDVVYEEQIRRIERTDALTHRPIVKYKHATETMLINFPVQLGHVKPAGQVLLFRPADLHKDRTFPLELVGDTLQVISMPHLEKGLWRAKLDWTSGGIEYYLEQMFMVN